MPGKQFSSEYQPEKNGRKKNKLKDLIKKSEFSTQDIRAIFANIVAVDTVEEIGELINDPRTNFLIKAYLKAMLKDYSKGKTDTVDKLIEYAFGKPRQIIETTNKNVNENIDYSKKSTAELKERKKQLIKQLIEDNKDIVKEITDGKEN